MNIWITVALLGVFAGSAALLGFGYGVRCGMQWAKPKESKNA